MIDLLRKEGKNEHVQQAIQELQQKFGVDPGKLAEKAFEKELG